MVNNIWALRREITQNNAHICPNECANQITRNHQSPNTHFKTLQNPFTNLNNHNHGRYNEKNIGDNKTLPMVPFSFTSNNPNSFVTTARYGGTLPLSSCNIPLTPYPPNESRNSSSIGVGSKGYATGYQNSSRPILHNQKNFRYSPYGETSNHINNSLLFNDSISHSRIHLNSYQALKDFDIPKANPPPFRRIEIKDLDLFYSSGDGNANSTMEHRVFDIRKTDAWKRSIIQKKELHLFKDDKNTIAVIENSDAHKKDDENLDLSLHL